MMKHIYAPRGDDNRNPVVSLTIEIGGQLKIIKGRDARALSELISGGLVGVTPIERLAPRWSHYVHKLGRAGIHVETIEEKHGGAYAGTHARYVLRSSVRVIGAVRQNDKKSKRKDRARGFAPLLIPISPQCRTVAVSLPA